MENNYYFSKDNLILTTRKNCTYDKVTEIEHTNILKDFHNGTTASYYSFKIENDNRQYFLLCAVDTSLSNFDKKLLVAPSEAELKKNIDTYKKKYQIFRE